MDLRHLRTFVAVAEQGTVSKAALRLHVAQPALSRQINDLEEELGLRLFDRVGRRLILTGQGEQLLAECRSVLSHVGSFSGLAELLRRGESGVLKIGASPQMIESVFSTFLPKYAERYPNVQAKLTEATGSDTLAKLERGELHLGVSLLQAVQADDRHFGRHPLPPIDFLAACQTKCPLGHDGMVDIAQLAEYPLLLLDSSFVVRKTFDAACRLAGLKPNILIESRAPHTLLALAEAGLGVAIIPSAVRTHRYTLRIVRVTHRRKPLREPLAVLWNKRRVLPPYAKGFCDLLAEHMREVFPISQPSKPDVVAEEQRATHPKRAAR
jgi:DNA-binding transcriptional LysR family regulator